MDQRGGNLTNKNFNEQQSADVTRKILSALHYMHSKGVTHRDVKLENIMVDRLGEIKLIDFGLATKYQSEDHTNLTDTVGTLYSMAPEVLEGTSYDYKADLWSTGVVTYLLLSRKQPFWGPMEKMSWPKRRLVMMEAILKCQYAPMDGEDWLTISQDAKYFVESLLQYDPNDRPTASVALQSKWIQAYAMTCFKSATTYQEHGEALKSRDRASEFRLKAWRILSTKFNLPSIEQLDIRLCDRDTTGQGFVGVDDLLLHIQEVGGSVLGEDDIKTLKEEISISGNDYQIEYIDFITEVKRGRKRTVIDRVIATIGETDTANACHVKLGSVMKLVDKDVIPVEIREEFRHTVLTLLDFHGDHGTISTRHLSDWMEKRLARQQTKGIDHT
jgi:calcium-dependent protein kinase